MDGVRCLRTPFFSAYLYNIQYSTARTYIHILYKRHCVSKAFTIHLTNTDITINIVNVLLNNPINNDVMNNFEFNEPNDFIEYINSDKSSYMTATEAGYIDHDNDFLIGKSGGFLMNIDFTFTDIHLLKKVAKVYETNGKYIDHEVDTPPHKKFRLREEFRRKKGFSAPCKLNRDGSVTDLRITGDHYNFINYGRMLKLDEILENGVTGRKKQGFPNYIDAQYWWFKIKEFCTNNGFNEIVCKTRRGGFSYSEGIDTANEINLNPDYTVLLAAELKDYLTKGNAIANMARNQIYFYENHTPFNRGIISRDLENIKLGFKNTAGDDDGWLSKMLCASSFNNPECAIGKDAVKVKAEEIGKFSNFDDFCTQTMPTLRTGAYVTGKLTAFGTINNDDTSREVFSTNFYNPTRWSFMPFENVWDKDARHLTCGYYKPYWWGLEGTHEGQLATDENGNTHYKVAIQIVEDEQRKTWENADTLKDYGDYIGQYGNRPEDSFGASFSNIFVSEGLLKHITNVEANQKNQIYRDGKYDVITDTRTGKPKGVTFITNDKLYNDNRSEDIHEYVTDRKPSPKRDNHGCVREYHPPIMINGEVPKGLYRIWVDPYGVDKDSNKEITEDNSLGSIGVYMNSTNLNGERGDRMVAYFTGRPPKQADFDKIVLYMAYRYNAKVFPENDRGTVIQNFKHWHESSKLVSEPSLAWDTKLQGSNGRDFGISIGQGTGRKLNGILYHKEWLYTERGKDINGNAICNYHTIDDLPLLNEYRYFNSAGNFDRISMMIVGAYDVKELMYTLRNFVDGKDAAKAKDKTSIFKRNWYQSQ